MGYPTPIGGRLEQIRENGNGTHIVPLIEGLCCPYFICSYYFVFFPLLF